MKKIGVLALQGAISEHKRSIEKAGHRAMLIKNPKQLAELDGIILPGGESTTMRHLMKCYHFIEPLKDFYRAGKGIFGTCAGMVLSANKIESEEEGLGFIHAKAIRNGFGRQKESFEASLSIKSLTETPFQAVFIRAPYLTEPGEQVEVLATIDEKIVAAKEKNVLVTAFHPELTEDKRLINYFIQACL